METAPKKQQLQKRHEALKAERSTWMTDWRDIADHMRPRAFRDQRTDANRSSRSKGSKIINFTPIESARTLASGMMTGITSPARPWFRLTVSGSPELSDSPAVKEWLSTVERVLREAAAKSNIYNGLHMVYADLGPFCVSAMHVEADDEDGARCYVFPVGSYCLAASARGNVDTIFREVSLTVAQLVELFGLEACSEVVKRHHEKGELDQRVDVTHAIYPRTDYVEGQLGPKGKRFASDWWETSSPAHGGFLREAGFDSFPVLCPRWIRTGEDVYGTGPGFDAIGDCRQLQLLERRAAQAADKIVNPPMSAPVAARSTPISLLPGETNFVDGLGAGQALRPAVQIDPAAIDVFERKIAVCENRIRKAFFAHLWLLITEQTGQMTATEVDQRREEKLQQLGAVLEALNDELLDPLLDLLFDICLAAGTIPPPPAELEGVDLKPEYISIMAQAQKLLATTGLERLAAFAGNLSKLDPSVLDKVDLDQLVDEYADSVGVPPSTVRPDAVVEERRKQRAQAQQQQAETAQLQQQAETAKTLADTDLEKPSALSTMLRGVSAR